MFVSNTSAFFSADFFNAKNRVFEKPFSQHVYSVQFANPKILQYFEYDIFVLIMEKEGLSQFEFCALKVYEKFKKKQDISRKKYNWNGGPAYAAKHNI